MRIWAAAAEKVPPFSVDAIVLEDDTQLVLGADPFPKERYEPQEQLLKRALASEAEPPGTVLVREDVPLRFLAVVHDLELDPSWREGWIASALLETLREAEGRRLRSIALPMIGTLHGTLEPGRFTELLKTELEEMWLENLENVGVVVPPGTERGVFDTLNEFDCEIRL